MSVSASLYVATTEDCLCELRDSALGDFSPALRDYLRDADSTLYTSRLNELYEKNGSSLKHTPADRFLRIILWSWIGEERPCGISKEECDEHVLDLAITPQQIRALSPLIDQLDSASMAETLFDEIDAWQTRGELQQYLDLWLQAFRDAADSGKGVFYKIWEEPVVPVERGLTAAPADSSLERRTRRLVSVRSGAVAPEEVGAIIACLEQRYSEVAFSRFGAAEAKVMMIPCRKLFPVDALLLTHDEVNVTHYPPTAEGEHPELRDLFDQYASKTRRSLLKWDTSETERDHDPEESDLRLGIGWTDGYFCSVGTGGASPGSGDLEYRRDLFVRVLTHMGLEQWIEPNIESGTLWVWARGDWRLHFMEAGINGEDPSAFEIYGFSNFARAWQSVQGALQNVPKRILDVYLFAKMSKETYDELREPFNRAASDWELYVHALLTPEAESVIEGAPTTDSTPQRIPAFKWSEYGGNEASFHGAVVMTPEGRHLELTTDCGDLERLLARANCMENVTFTPVED